ncbi:MAG: hypothetical protein HOP02_16720 [Methylococcaceae bacterium]|nr:hypothetical protein [Methylococcaceae bacterium]
MKNLYGYAILLFSTRKVESSNPSRQTENRQYNRKWLSQRTKIPNPLEF